MNQKNDAPASGGGWTIRFSVREPSGIPFSQFRLSSPENRVQATPPPQRVFITEMPFEDRAAVRQAERQRETETDRNEVERILEGLPPAR